MSSYSSVSYPEKSGPYITYEPVYENVNGKVKVSPNWIDRSALLIKLKEGIEKGHKLSPKALLVLTAAEKIFLGIKQ